MIHHKSISHSNRETPVLQLDYTYTIASGENCDALEAKATLLSVSDSMSDSLGQIVVIKKGPDDWIVRWLTRWIEIQSWSEVFLHPDREHSLMSVCNAVKLKRPESKSHILPAPRGEHKSVGEVERAHGILHGGARAMRFEYARRTQDDIKPGHALYEWLVRRNH